MDASDEDQADPINSGPDVGFDQDYDLEFVPSDLRETYEVHSWRNAAAVLASTHKGEWSDILEMLRSFRLRKSHLVKIDAQGAETAAGGGRKSLIATSLDEPLYKSGWLETLFQTEISVEATHKIKKPRIGKQGQTLKTFQTVRETFQRFEYRAPTHNVDCYKNKIAVEVEWNNKDPFFDRDLNNFRLLFDLRVIEVGVIITRCDELDEVFAELLTSRLAKERYGATTTRMSKLLRLLKGGGGGGCPVLVFGITKKLYDEKA